MPSRDYPAVQGPPPDNAEIARQLDAFASLLELADAGPYTARAYRRAADLIRSTPAPVAELVREGRVRELRGIGPGIERRLRELVETGEIAELKELERDVSPELAGLGRFLGVSVKRMLEIGRVLGVRTLEELREAAREGRLREVPGIGPETERKLLAALAREPRPAAPRPLLLHRSRPLVESIAEALGGVAAGDPRRWLDASERLAVVVPAEEPEPVLDAVRGAAADRGGRGAAADGGRSASRSRACPVELVVAEPGELGHRARAGDGIAGVRRRARSRSRPRPTRRASTAALGIPFVPPELREAAFRGEPPRLRRARRRPRRPAHAHDLVGREGVGLRDGPGGARARLRVPRDLRPHGQRRRRAGPRRRTPCAARPRRSPRRTSGWRRSGCCAGPSATSCATARSTSRTTCSRELDWVQASVHGGQRGSREELTKRVLTALDIPYVSAA